VSEEIAEIAFAEGERTHVLGLLVSFITGLPRLFFPIAAILFGTARNDEGTFFMPFIIAAVLLASLFFRWIGWLRFRFYLDADDIRIEQGIVNRTVRSIPYDRIQDVSIEEKPLARLLGLSEVKFESGGGEGEDAKLSFVTMDRAAALRETVRARKLVVTDVDAAPEHQEIERPPVFAMDNDRLLTLGFYSFSLVIFAVLGGLAQQFDFLLPFDFWEIKEWIGMAEDSGVSIDGISTTARIIGALFALVALVAIGVATGMVRTVLKEYGFRLDRTERGFRRRRGFLTRTDVVMPVNRVQAANIVTGPIRKRRGWHALKLVSLAQDSKEESDFMAAPLARLDEIWPIAAMAGIYPPADAAALKRGHFAWWLVGFVALLPIICAAMAAMILLADSSFAKALLLLILPLALLVIGYFEWRVYRYGIDHKQVFARQGWWRQKLLIVPQVRIQSVEITQGPLARLAGLVTLHFGVAGGSAAMIALPLAEARAIRDAVMAQVAPVDFSELNQRDG
jgi:putative membrane protein